MKVKRRGSESERLWLAQERVHPDRPVVGPGRVEGMFGEAGRCEPAPDSRSEVGLATMTRPDDGRLACAQLWQRFDRALHVAITDVSEDSAREHQLRRDGIRVDVGDGRIRADHVDAVELGGRGSLSSTVGKLRVELDQQGSNLLRARVLRQHIEKVAPIARTEADHARRSGRASVEEGADVPLDDLETLRQRRLRICIRVMPVDPVGAL